MGKNEWFCSLPFHWHFGNILSLFFHTFRMLLLFFMGLLFYYYYTTISIYMMIKFIFLYIFRLMFITCVSGSKTVLCWLMHTLSCSCTSLYLTCILFSFLQAGLTQASKSSSTSSPSLQCMVTMYLLHAITLITVLVIITGSFRYSPHYM